MSAMSWPLFADYWRSVTGHDVGLLIFDSNVASRTHLHESSARGIQFLSLRARSPKLTA